MQTHFTDEQRQDPDIQMADDILRKCVHCGFCLATCPTYLLSGDERDSPRGRIYQIKTMLEEGEAASETVTTHIDRCLSCLSCVTTCPSGVDYMHLVDLARAKIEETNPRPPQDKAFRALLAAVLPRPRLFRAMLTMGRLARPFTGLMPKKLRPAVAMAKSAPARDATAKPQTFPAEGERKMRVALLTGCVQPALDPEINAATVRLLTRHGVEVVVAEGMGCCGAMEHHMGRETAAKSRARTNIAAWMAEAEKEGGLDAVVINASGCGTMVKDYGVILRLEPEAEPAQRIAGLAKDVTEILADLDLKPARETGQVVAYQSPCSMQHGQKVDKLPKRLLSEAGFDVKSVPEGHICCGSAGTYNLLQPEWAGELKARKAANIESVQPDVIATGNIGCEMQLSDATGIPIMHTVQLLDWATGGPEPEGLPAARPVEKTGEPEPV